MRLEFFEEAVISCVYLLKHSGRAMYRRLLGFLLKYGLVIISTITTYC